MRAWIGATRTLLCAGALGAAVVVLGSAPPPVRAAEHASSPPAHGAAGRASGQTASQLMASASATPVRTGDDALPLATSPARAPRATGGGDLAINPLDLAIKLGLVVGLLMVTLRVLRALQGRKGAGALVGGPGGLTLYSEPLGAGQRVFLLDLDDRVLVVGGTATHLAALAEVSAPESAAALRQRYGPTAKEIPASFKAALADVLTAHGPSPRQRHPLAEPPGSPPGRPRAIVRLGDSVRALRELRREVDKP